MLQNLLEDSYIDFGLDKTQWTEIITKCGNLILDFKHTEVYPSPFFLQTLVPYFPNEMHNWISSTKTILDPCATIQSFFLLRTGKTLLMFSLVHKWLNATTVAWSLLKPSVHGGSWCIDSSPTSKAFPSSGIRLQSSLLLVYIFLPCFSLPVKLPWLCFDVAPSVAYPPYRDGWWSSSRQLSRQQPS